jgi:hypothetical protein
MQPETKAQLIQLLEKLRQRGDELYVQGEFIAVTELRTVADHLEHKVSLAKAGIEP